MIDSQLKLIEKAKLLVEEIICDRLATDEEQIKTLRQLGEYIELRITALPQW